jgi:transcriptional regulator with XRE-family HTH domain
MHPWTYGEVIRDAREALGLTQAELANAIGVSSIGVSRWENNRSTPGFENRIAIAEVLKLAPEQVGIVLPAFAPPENIADTQVEGHLTRMEGLLQEIRDTLQQRPQEPCDDPA